MGKKKQFSFSMDEEFMDELDEIIEKYDLTSRSALIQKWARIGFKKLKEVHGIPLRHEIAPEISKPKG